ncbi:zinc finger protein 277 isoform X2 [Eurytemora carolleeae]|uniref:zinc finger protein 277 isoform X2 n=1 Tax=Eurytemora carolleeae TaxID=1294199 RepID=UPI000C76D2F2|nr:zinc finger protein 277 isoform X2 [Eurytemora carolleeae]|eukprot:XP_023344580.1 zinc finger protein 277-like isoform X2 [Eurytemora affinis]
MFKMDEYGPNQQLILEALKLPELDTNIQILNQDLVCLLCEEKFSDLSQIILKDAVDGSHIPEVLEECKKEENGEKTSVDGYTEDMKKSGKDLLLQHLLLTHSFVIADVQLIADFPQYVRYWKNKFNDKPVTAYCTSLRAEVSTQTTEAGTVKEMRDFSLLSDIVPEDKELRKKLQLERLEQVLKIHEQENGSQQFSRICLYCKKVFSQHSKLFDHMAFDHNFSVGQPANLVFVNKLLDLLQGKLDGLVCLYCEKVFKSREVLKEHMRKKGHKKLNPHNKMYDEFYLVNYLEFGKNWEDISREGGEEEIVSGFDVDQDDNYEWSDWKDNVGRVICLFCPASYNQNQDLFLHMEEVHGFNFTQIKQDLKLDFYQQVKMINYIRRCVHLNTCIGCSEVFPTRDLMLEHLNWSNHYTPQPGDWNQPQFFFPTYENDNLLHCLEDDNEMSSVPIVAEELKTEISDSILQDELVRISLGKRNL